MIERLVNGTLLVPSFVMAGKMATPVAAEIAPDHPEYERWLRAWCKQEGVKYNPYHDNRGRFTSGGGAISVSIARGGYSEQQKERIGQATGASLNIAGERLAKLHEFTNSDAGRTLLTSNTVSSLRTIADGLKPGEHSGFLSAGGVWTSPPITAKFGGKGWSGGFNAGDEIRKFKPTATVIVQKVGGVRDAISIERTPGDPAWSGVSVVRQGLSRVGSVPKYISATANLRDYEQRDLDNTASTALTAAVFGGWAPPVAKKAASTEDLALLNAWAAVDALQRERPRLLTAFLAEAVAYAVQVEAAG